MATQRAIRFGILAAPLTLAVILTDCSSKPTAPKDSGPDQPPETEITFAPLDSDTVYYRVHVYWYGFDKDGEVVRYRIALDADTTAPEVQWKSTTAKDSTLLLPVKTATGTMRHVIEVAAEDNDHFIDPTPARRAFSTHTIPPTSCIVKGPGQNSTIGSDFAFTSQGTDPDWGLNGTV